MRNERHFWNGGWVLALVALCAMVIPVEYVCADDRGLAVFVMPKQRKGKAVAVMLGSIVRERTAEMAGVTLYTGSPGAEAVLQEEIETLINAGFKALNSGAGDVLSPFERAWELLEDTPAAGTPTLHARVAKGLGIARLGQGKKAEAARLIKRSLLIFPNQGARQYAYSVEAQEAYLRAKNEIQDMAKGTISVKSIPSGAEVSLDGVFKGYTPIPLQGVSAGGHLLELRLQGYKRWSASPTVTEGGTVAVDANLVDWEKKQALRKALSTAKKNLSAAKFLRAAKPLAALTGAKEVLVLEAASRGGRHTLSGFHWDGADKVTPVDADLSDGLDERVREMLAGALGMEYKNASVVSSLGSPPLETIKSVIEKSGALLGDITVDPDSPLFQLSEKEKKDSVLDKWWFWTAIGGGAALTVTAIVLAVVLKDEAGPGSVGDLSIEINRF